MQKSIFLMLLFLITIITPSCFGKTATKQNNIELSGFHTGLFIPALCPGITPDDSSQDNGSIQFWSNHIASLYVDNRQQITMGDFFINRLNLDDAIPVPCMSGASKIQINNCYVQKITLQNCKYKNNAFSADYVLEFLDSYGQLKYRKGVFGFHN